ncbi:MAG TPA: CRTAC1 family protein [Vicinamibacteria bacterium]|nr:CRTAC1 family protein [Vicinamibacteria bacterium]
MRRWLASAGLLVLAAFGMAQLPGPPLLFRDVTSEAGIAFRHHAAPEKKYIMESMSGGVALLDFDNDGLLDIYLTDSLTVDTARDPKAARSALYRNLGNGRFQDVTERAGVGHPGWAMGVCTADVDGDGWEDIYVTGLERNTLYHNNHDGTFSDVTAQAGLTGGGWSTGCGFADYDRDGNLDLFVSRYVRVDLTKLPEFGKGGAGMKGAEGRGATCQFRGVAVQCGPRGLPGESDLLFHNDGDGHFTEVSAKVGVADTHEYYGLGVGWFDYNGDGWPDLYVANDSHPNYLYENQKNGTFREVGFPAGVAVSEDGGEQGSMGVAVGDYDNSGRFSLFVTDFSEEYDALYHNEGDHFSDLSFRSLTAPSSLPFVKWGTSFFDYDNDGFLDLMVVNGHVYPQADQMALGASAGYRQRKLLYHNRGDGRFDEVAERFGEVMTRQRVGRGLAVGDLDNDGRLDVVVNNLDGTPEVLHNELPAPGHWLMLKLVGKGKNTDAIGAVARVAAGKLKMTRVVQSGSSYLSQEDKRLHFGLGAATRAEVVEVRWPDGTTTTTEGVPADRILTVRQP